MDCIVHLSLDFMVCIVLKRLGQVRDGQRLAPLAETALELVAGGHADATKSGVSSSTDARHDEENDCDHGPDDLGGRGGAQRERRDERWLPRGPAAGNMHPGGGSRSDPGSKRRSAPRVKC